MAAWTRGWTLTSLAMLALAAGATAAPVLYVDTAGGGTRVLDDFNDGVDTSTALYQLTSLGESGGLARFLADTPATDPRIRWNISPPFNTDSYPFLRIGWQGEAGGLEVFPLPESATTRMDFGTTPASLAEKHRRFVVPGTDKDPTGTRLRLDPYGPVAGKNVAYDYLMVDILETRGLGEWDAEGEVGGWALGRIGAATVADSLLAGSAIDNGDAMIYRTDLGIDTSLYRTIEIHMKATPGSRGELFWGESGFVQARSIAWTAADDQFHTYFIDMSGEPTWTGTINALRLDPVQGVGRTFEVDYIRISAVPEPATLSLLGLGALAIARRRRQRR